MSPNRLVTRALVVLAGLSVLAPGVAGQGPAEVRDTGDYLYRFVIVQAAPGRLLDLIELYRSRMPVIAAGGDELPFVVRHAQGDHWDLCVIYPSGSFTEYYSRERVAKRQAAGDASGVRHSEFAARFYSMVSWHEDLYAVGPPLDVFRAHVRGAGLAHFEMLLALPGKRDELVKERQMENAFNRERGRGGTLIFVHDQGASWDVITLGVYRDWRHYGEQEAIPADVSAAAAKKAGFASAEAIGPYMRTLISTHRDTLGPVLPMGLR